MVGRIVTEMEVKAAADVLRRVSKLYDFDPELGEWSPAMLLNELSHIKYNNDQEEIYAKVAEPLVQLAMTGSDLPASQIVDRVFEVLRRWEISER